ncbi:MAG: response regulator [Okeania sp. SIO3B5]|uniref:response regulator n=1 Tax=Okeania sp. SIO3B5 TaxID=2607811 RepID=UPI00140195F2|nr:response regulator [Okeania sp. SIO3B5]NEO58882.1 response regulator [Okeania sp. SIO3B5]
MKTVLLVEEDALGVRVFSKILTKRGRLNVKRTENVEEVMEIAQAGEADLILINILGNCSYQGKAVGVITITQMLKANPKTAHLPVIIVTAAAINRESFLQETGADDCIFKPVIDHQECINQIKALLPSD